VKLAVVVQRYGAEINGGAELHARYIAELLAARHQVEVLTSCARDYVTWRNDLPAGDETVNGITVRRFETSSERDPIDFGLRSRVVFHEPHSLAQELAWLRSEGPTSPALVRYIRRHADRYDLLLFFSFRYYHAYHGIRAAPARALLVPTAEREPAVGLSLFAPIFRGVRGIMYNSHEEQAMIRAVSDNAHVPGVVVGVGSKVPERTSPQRFRRTHGLSGPFVVYVGRIDENKGCKELFDFFLRYASARSRSLSLVLIGNSILPIPEHPRIRHLGFVSDEEKFDAIAAAEALVMPSFYESLSMVALEAWALGRPVLANGRCDVLRGQCIRSNAGLYYDTYEEFAEALLALTTDPALNEGLGARGRAYYRAHYTWPVIERKYQDMLERVSSDEAAAGESRLEPLPGWLARRHRTSPAATEVLARVPTGAAQVDRDGRSHVDRPRP
jgi:glycosyltransferase involved in cell wall biosynthesis